MKAAVFHGSHDVRIEEVSDPGSPRADEVVLEVIRAAICGTDAAEWDHGPVLCRPGVVLGHEFVGRVVDLGAEVTGFRRGDRVVSGAGISCGRCHWCLRSRTNLCAEYRTLGSAGRRRARRVRHVPGRDLPCGPGRLRRRRGCDDTAPCGCAACAVTGCTRCRRVGRGHRRRRHRLFHRRGRSTASGRGTACRDRHRRRATVHCVGARRPRGGRRDRQRSGKSSCWSSPTVSASMSSSRRVALRTRPRQRPSACAAEVGCSSSAYMPRPVRSTSRK